MSRWDRLVRTPEMYRHPRQHQWARQGITPGFLLAESTLDTQTGCWVWGRCTRAGYGTVKVGGQLQLVHRLAYLMIVGPIPDGHDLDHLCENKACCNPEHLEVVTRASNMQRAWQRKHGLPLSPADAKPNRNYPKQVAA